MKTALVAATAVLTLSTPAFAMPMFYEFPAVEQDVGYHAPLLTAPRATAFRTRLREAASKPENFAGHFRLTTWGCGTGCAQGAVVDHATGRVTFLPAVSGSKKLGNDPLFDPYLFHGDSRLLVVAGKIDDEGADELHFYAFDGQAFKHLSDSPYVD